MTIEKHKPSLSNYYAAMPLVKVIDGATLSAYISHDNQTWEQVMTGDLSLFKQCYVGLIYRGNPWNVGECQWLTSP